jgi:hypothetical protein
MDGLDLKKLAAEVTAEHGIRVDPDDPMMAVITLNRLVFEEAVGRAVARLQANADEIDKAAGRMQVRAGTVIAHELKECTADFERQLRAASESFFATAKQTGGPLPLQTKAAWFAIGLTAALALLLLGVYFGMHIPKAVSTGG